MCKVSKSALTYNEENGAGYYSQTLTLDVNNEMLLNEPFRTDVHTMEFAPFEYRNTGDAEEIIREKEQYNALGFRGKIPDDSTTTLITFGDSFTESVCVTEENSYPVKLEKLINDSLSPVQILNAGVSGNDPFFDWKMLHKLHPKFPKLQSVVFLMNTTDINEVVIRGGFSRFKANGLIQYNPGPKWEYLYAVSHIFRIFANKLIGVNYNLLTHKQQSKASATAINSIHEMLTDSLIPYCQKNQIELIVALHPVEWELKGELSDYLKMDSMLLDVAPLNYVNTFPSIQKEYLSNPDMFYHIDGHFKEVGYAIIAQEIFYEIAKNKSRQNITE